jgi:dimethylargininase
MTTADRAISEPRQLRVARVIVRDISPAFARCEREDRDVAIDVQLARRQHRAYAQTIEALGIEVVSLPASKEHPDCVFVEDTAVVIDADNVVITRPGAPSRRGEVPVVAACLEGLGCRLHEIPATARLDGGDVLRVDDHLFVGLSGRTNLAGADALRWIAASYGLSLHIVSVRSGLHLKTGCSLADDSTLVYSRQSQLDPASFMDVGLTCVAVDEPMGGNVLYLGGGAVLVSDAAPRTASWLAERGLSTHVLHMSELHKADAALTCPSIRLPARGTWCT